MNLRSRISTRLKKLTGPELEIGNRRAKTLAVASNKGGVGKTTTAVHVALGFAREGAAVLLVDLDPQAHVSASLDAQHNGERTLGDVLLGKGHDVQEAVYPSGHANLDLAGSEKDLSEVEAVIAAKIGKELILDGALEVARTHYDLIVFDCPPNLGTLTLNALCAADALLIPSDMSVLALEGIGDILAAVDTVESRLRRTIDVLGVVATRFDRRTTSVNANIEQSMGELYGRRLLTSKIPMSSSVAKAQMAGAPLYDFDKKSPATRAYLELLTELRPGIGLSLAAKPSLAPAVARASAPN